MLDTKDTIDQQCRCYTCHSTVEAYHHHQITSNFITCTMCSLMFQGTLRGARILPINKIKFLQSIDNVLEHKIHGEDMATLVWVYLQEIIHNIIIKTRILSSTNMFVMDGANWISQQA